MKSPPPRSIASRALALGGAGLAAALSTSVGAAGAETYPGCPAPPALIRRRMIANPSTLATELARARDGDMVYLVGGNYGQAVIAGAHAGFVTVTAAPGERPRFSSLKIRDSGWALSNLTIVGPSPPHLYGRGRAHLPLVVISGGKNIIFKSNVVASTQTPYPWREEILPGQADEDTIRDQPAPSDGIHVTQESCVAIFDNKIFNIFNGVQVTGDQQDDHGRFFVISDNVIDNFAGDGIDHSVSDAIIRRNLITNVRNTCQQKCVHSDGIQGWTYNDRPGVTNDHILIDSNRIFARVGPPSAFSDGPFQGITIFDGAWRDVRVINNVVIDTIWAAISLSGVDGLVVANNTAAGIGGLPARIGVGGVTHEGGKPDHETVANNVASTIQFPSPGFDRHLVVENNLTNIDPQADFVRFDVRRGLFDLRLRSSAAAGQGDPRFAPSTDVEGKPRRGKITLGAYQ